MKEKEISTEIEIKYYKHYHHSHWPQKYQSSGSPVPQNDEKYVLDSEGKKIVYLAVVDNNPHQEIQEENSADRGYSKRIDFEEYTYLYNLLELPHNHLFTSDNEEIGTFKKQADLLEMYVSGIFKNYHKVCIIYKDNHQKPKSEDVIFYKNQIIDNHGLHKDYNVVLIYGVA